MITSLCMCKIRMGHSNDLNSKSHWLTTSEFDIGLPVKVMSENWNYIRDETHTQDWTQWCRTSHKWSGQRTTQTGTTNDRHAAFVYASNCINLRTDVVHMVKTLKIACGRSWKLRRTCGMSRGEDSGLNISTTCVRIYMGLIAGRTGCKVIGRRHLSLR